MLRRTAKRKPTPRGWKFLSSGMAMCRLVHRTGRFLGLALSYSVLSSKALWGTLKMEAANFAEVLIPMNYLHGVILQKQTSCRITYSHLQYHQRTLWVHTRCWFVYTVMTTSHSSEGLKEMLTWTWQLSSKDYMELRYRDICSWYCSVTLKLWRRNFL